jgi:hypothetical protein
MQFYDVLMEFDRKIIGFEFESLSLMGMERRKSINKVLWF